MSGDLAFVVPTHSDPTQLKFCLLHLRAAYPSNRVLVFHDSAKPDAGIREVVARCAATLFEGERILSVEQGGHCWRRFADEFLKTGARFLARIDTDTKFFRPFRTLPDVPAWGCIWGSYGWRYLHGGCQVLRRDLVEKVLEIAKDPKWTEIGPWCPAAAVGYQITRGTVSMDFLLASFLLELDVPLIDSLEIWSVGHVKDRRHMDQRILKLVDNKDGRFACTHPHKLGDPLLA
jgi:hypothetical protein